MSGVKLTENAARVIGEQALWARNQPRSLPTPPEESLNQGSQIALFEITGNTVQDTTNPPGSTTPGKEYKTTGKFVYWDNTLYQYNQYEGTGIGGLPDQDLYYACAVRKTDGTANYPVPYQVGVRVWCINRGRWEILPAPMPLYVSVGGTGQASLCDSSGYHDGTLYTFVNGTATNVIQCKVQSLWQSGGSFGAPLFSVLLIHNYPVLDLIGTTSTTIGGTATDIPIVLVNPGQQTFWGNVASGGSHVNIYGIEPDTLTSVAANMCLADMFLGEADPIPAWVAPSGTGCLVQEVNPGKFVLVNVQANNVAYTPQSGTPDGLLLHSLKFSSDDFDTGGDSSGDPVVSTKGYNGPVVDGGGTPRTAADGLVQ